jgi:hypothetical protein
LATRFLEDERRRRDIPDAGGMVDEAAQAPVDGQREVDEAVGRADVADMVEQSAETPHLFLGLAGIMTGVDRVSEEDLFQLLSGADADGVVVAGRALA